LATHIQQRLTLPKLTSIAERYRFEAGEVEHFYTRFERIRQHSELTLETLKQVMSVLGCAEAITEGVFRLMDKAGRGAVNFEEYLEYLDILTHGTANQRAEASFLMATRTSEISYRDLYSWLTCVWRNYNVLTRRSTDAEELSKEFLRRLDVKEDECIDLQEYRTRLADKAELLEWFDLINQSLADQLDGLRGCLQEPPRIENEVGIEKPSDESREFTPLILVTREEEGLQETMADLQRSQDSRGRTPSPSLNSPSSNGSTPKQSFFRQSDDYEDDNRSLMIHMLTGISKGVSSATSTFNPLSELTDTDFTARAKHRLRTGKTRGRTAKLVDIAPHVFEKIRRFYEVSSEQYLSAMDECRLTSGDYSDLKSFSSQGKSGSQFYFSGDFLLKTIQHSEYLFFKANLQAYFEHLTSNPQTLLCRVFGLYKLTLVKELGTVQVYFVVMGNVFSSDVEIHEQFDLKGSTYDRVTDPDDRMVTRKDLDFVNAGVKISLGPEGKAEFLEQLGKDCEFLMRLNVIDYSLLLGIHRLSSPAPPQALSRGRRSESCVYYMGIIDIFTCFDTRKKLEHAWKSSFFESVSCVPPQEYAERFVRFMECGVID
jgi:Ca2+-binding EF-hand superfamily protein